ncbi:MAG: sugar phosphate isomerase/epimerase [Bacteroidetes bacterium]|nr:sugar phosphate isomerase/epimerase [Bacteroidota bacterium]
MILGCSHTSMHIGRDLLVLLREHGVSHLEMRITEIEAGGALHDRIRCAELADLLRSEGLGASLHSYPGVNLAEKIARIRATAVDIVAEQMEFGERLGARWLSVHLGTCGFSRTSAKKAGRLEVGIEAVERVLERTAGMRIRVGLENTQRLPDACMKSYLGDTPDECLRMLAALPADRVGMVFDTGHAAIDPLVPPIDFLAAVQSHVVGVHLHANDGAADLHRPVTGEWIRHNAAMAARLLQIGIAGRPIIVEHHTLDAARISLATMREFAARSTELPA